MLAYFGSWCSTFAPPPLLIYLFSFVVCVTIADVVQRVMFTSFRCCSDDVDIVGTGSDSDEYGQWRHRRNAYCRVVARQIWSAIAREKRRWLKPAPIRTFAVWVAENDEHCNLLFRMHFDCINWRRTRLRIYLIIDLLFSLKNVCSATFMPIFIDTRKCLANKSPDSLVYVRRAWLHRPIFLSWTVRIKMRSHYASWRRRRHTPDDSSCSSYLIYLLPHRASSILPVMSASWRLMNSCCDRLPWRASRRSRMATVRCVGHKCYYCLCCWCCCCCSWCRRRFIYLLAVASDFVAINSSFSWACGD